MANVIIKQDFVQSNNDIYDKYEGFIDYLLDKEKSTSYVDYINNKEKTETKAFNYENNLNAEAIEKIRDEFSQSRIDGSNLYRSVISFENDFLRENKIIDENDNIIDNYKLNLAIQSSVIRLQTNSRIKNNDFVWIANFHFNTDNIHCHIAYIDKNEKNMSKWQKNKMVINTKGFEQVKSEIIKTITVDKELLKDKSVQRDILRKSLKDIKLKNNVYNKLYKKYGKKLLYVNTKKDILTTKEKKDIANTIIKELAKKDNKFKKEYEIYLKLEKNNLEKNIKNYGKKKNDIIKLSDIDKSVLTAFKREFRELYNDNKINANKLDQVLKIKNNKKLKNYKKYYNKFSRKYYLVSGTVAQSLDYSIKKSAYKQMNQNIRDYNNEMER